MRQGKIWLISIAFHFTGKKKKKVSLPIIGNSASVSHVGVENYMMPMVPTPGYIPYWNDMQPLMEGFFPQYGVLPQDQFYMQRYVLPVVQPQRYENNDDVVLAYLQIWFLFSC